VVAGLAGGSGPAMARLRGQQLAGRELARSIYRPSLLTRWWQDIEGWLSSLVSGQSAGRPSWWGFVLVAAGLLAVAVAVGFWLGPSRAGRQVRNRPVLEAKPRSAAEHRAAAERLAAAGDYQAAIIECLRAIAVDLEARGILLPVPARTAMELAVEAGGVFPAEAAGLVSAARLFDDVRYGGVAGTQRGYDSIRGLDSRLAAAHATAAAPAVPRAAMPGLPSAGTVLSGADRAPGQLP
jgi:uncharacterized protein DUF4129